ncbi:hypothetical protein GGR54DRAFT_613611 [Hypoxylon sp. NC1633]|nr:hypothetical protein GGR54DRAFT_613611 [Hypoxylon sp. NC1633]
MAEIANSDSPDPLLSTPPRYFALQIPSSPSTFSAVSDLDSYRSDSSPRHLSLSIPSTSSDPDSLLSESPPSTDTQPRHLQSRLSSITDSEFTLSSMASSGNSGGGLLARVNRDLDNDHRNIYDEFYSPDGDVVLFAGPHSHIDREDSLFVSDDDNDGDNDGGNRGDDDLVVAEDNAGQDRPNFWPPSPVDFFENNQPAAPLGLDGSEDDGGDELVEIQLGRPVNNHDRRRGQARRPSRVRPEVIDLTGDNEGLSGSGELRAQHRARHRAQNERRRRLHHRGTPPNAEPRMVINLVSDSEDEPANLAPSRDNNPVRRANALDPTPPQELPQDQPRPRPHPQPQPQVQGRAPNFSQQLNQFWDNFQNMPVLRNMPVLEFFGGRASPPPLRGGPLDEDDIMVTGQRAIPGHPRLEPPLPRINLDYHAVAFGFANPGGPNPRAAHDPPQETRPGFTRTTGEDVVAICPSCEQELAFDPDGEEVHPTKKARTKKDKAEHHFWAVKACGHVYCKRCYDNRKPVGKNPVPVGFRPDPSRAKHKVLCAVEDCDSDVSLKAAWLGIFMS